MAKQTPVTANELAAAAKKFRIASGMNRAQAARALGVARQAVIYAEESPEKSFFKLRKRIIERYSTYTVIGPVFFLGKR